MTLLVLLLLTAAPDFQLVEETGGVRVESRPVSGSKFVELRFTATSPASVEALCDAAYGDGKLPADERNVRQRKVLSEGPDERVTYDVVSAPIVSDRDYVLRWTRSKSPQRCVVRFGITESRDAPPVDKMVRLTVLTGSWTFESVEGKTRVTYVSHSEPGGGIPPFLVEGTRRSTELDAVRRTLARAGH